MLDRPTISGMGDAVTPFHTAFWSQAKTAQNALTQEILRLPEPLNSVTADYYEYRKSRRTLYPMMTEYAPWAMADLLGITSSDVQPVALPWLMLNTYSLIVDDLLDKPDRIKRLELTLSSGILLSRGLHLLEQTVGSKSLAALVDNTFCELAKAVQQESVARSRVGRSDSDIKNFVARGKQVWMLKLCAEAVSICTLGKPLSDEQTRLVETLCAALQGMDDICDWREDWKQCQYSSLLSLALAGPSGRICSDVNVESSDAVLACIVASEALETHTRVIDRCLSEVLTSFHDRTDVPFCLHLEKTRSWVKSLERASNRCRALMIQDPANPEIQTELTELDNQIQIWANG